MYSSLKPAALPVYPPSLASTQRRYWIACSLWSSAAYRGWSRVSHSLRVRSGSGSLHIGREATRHKPTSSQVNTLTLPGGDPASRQGDLSQPSALPLTHLGTWRGGTA